MKTGSVTACGLHSGAGQRGSGFHAVLGVFRQSAVTHDLPGSLSHRRRCRVQCPPPRISLNIRNAEDKHYFERCWLRWVANYVLVCCGNSENWQVDGGGRGVRAGPAKVQGHGILALAWRYGATSEVDLAPRMARRRHDQATWAVASKYRHPRANGANARMVPTREYGEQQQAWPGGEMSTYQPPGGQPSEGTPSYSQPQDPWATGHDHGLASVPTDPIPQQYDPYAHGGVEGSA